MPDLATINKLFQDKQSKDPGWIDKITNIEKNKLRNEYVTAYRLVDDQISSLYRRLGDLTYGEMVKYNRLTLLNKNIYAEIRKIDPNVRQIIYEDINLEYVEAYYRKGWGFETSMEASINFDKLSPEQIQASLYKQYDFSTIKESMRVNTARINAGVQHSITQGLIQGYGYAKMTRGIKDNFNRGFKDAFRITRTEGHRAREIGNMDATEFARSKGVITKDIWSAVFDIRTRDTHGMADGRERNKEGYFELPGGVLTIAPGLSGVAEHDINCRCTVTHKIINFSPQYKRLKGVGIVKRNTAFKEWKKMKKIK